MGVSPVRFNGNDLYQPGYYAKRNIDKLNAGGASGSRLLLIGECSAGIPYNASTDYPNADNRVNWVSNGNENRESIRSGAAFDGAKFALTPSNQPGINGAPAVGVIRVNKAVKGTSVIVDVDTDNVLDVSSVDYGLKENQIRYKIVAGTNEGVKITTVFEDTTLERDDISYQKISLVYSGAATIATLTIDPAGNLVVTTSVANVPADDITISLATYNTIGSVVEYFNSHASGNYTAVILGSYQDPSLELDKVVGGDAVNIKTTPYIVRATLQAVIDYFTNSNELLNVVLSAAYERRVPDVMANYVYLTSGSDGGAVTITEYTEALVMAKLIDASFVVVMTGDSPIHAVLSTHCTEMSSTTGKNERQGITGSALADAKATKLADAAALNNSLVGYAVTETDRYNESGIQTQYAGFYMGAMVAGMMAGNAINHSPTNKQLNVLAVKEKYTNTEKDDYIKAGCMIAAPSELGGIRVIRAITSYQGTNIIANEMSAMREILYVTKDHRAWVQALIGEAGTGTTLESIRNRAELRLTFYKDNGIFVTDPAYGNFYRDFTFTVTGDVVEISYEATIVLPVNFQLVTHNFTVIGFKG